MIIDMGTYTVIGDVPADVLRHLERDEPACAPDYSHVPAMPFVAYLLLPHDDEVLRDLPEMEAFGLIEGPFPADEAQRPSFTGYHTLDFTGATPSCALAAAQAVLLRSRLCLGVDLTPARRRLLERPDAGRASGVRTSGRTL